MRKRVTFPSCDGRTDIHAVCWTPGENEVQAVVQIVHGMTEFVERYEPFARFLTERGFAVVGHDHLGHRTGGILPGSGELPACWAICTV